jgi:hypothetical protein
MWRDMVAVERRSQTAGADTALELGDPQQALTHFAAARQGTYSTEGYARDVRLPYAQPRTVRA